MFLSRPFLNKKIHISWLLAGLSAGLLAGIAAASIVRLEGWTGPLAIVGLMLLLPSFIIRKYYLLVVVVLAGAALGVARGTVVDKDYSDYKQYIGQSVVIAGTVSEDTTMDQDGQQRVRLKNVRIAEKTLPGEVWMALDSEAKIKRSDVLTVEGMLDEGFGNLPAVVQNGAILRVERARYADVARDIRDWFAEGVRRTITEPAASLGIGFLLGQRNALPEDITDQLRLLGLTHIIVASGYNLTILVRFARAAFARTSKYLAVVSAASMIGGFLLVTGASPSMTRAALVAGVSLLAWYFGRALHPVVLLLIAAASTAFIEPSFVWGDLGWYLSFLAFAGVMIIAPLLQHYFWGLHHPPGAVRRIVIETLSAQLATLPLIIVIFGQYSLLSLPANVLILPLIPVTMLLTFIGGLGGLAAPGLAVFVGLPASVLLQYMLQVSGWLADMPWATKEIAVGVPFLILSYIGVLVLVYWMARSTRHNFRNDNIVV